MKERKVLWAPWRMEFIRRAHQKQGGCIFCSLPKKGANSKTLILSCNKNTFVILNRYPYTNGHLLVVPRRHTDLFESLSIREHQALGRVLAVCMTALKKEFHAQGFNVGLNLGSAAGAGIEGHLHYHVVPRWKGDSNFMPIFGEVRTMPEHIVRTYQRLKKYFRI